MNKITHQASDQDFNHQANNLDVLLALRGIACLMIVITHCSPARNVISYQANDWSWILFCHPGVAVWMFFCLSGYLMGKAFYSGRYYTDIVGIINFWRNRALRIFPLYYFSLLILIIFVYPDTLRISNWVYIWRLITFTYQPFIVNPTIPSNEALWSLSTEVQFYLLVPFIYLLFASKLTSPKRALMAIFIAIVSIALLKFITLS